MNKSLSEQRRRPSRIYAGYEPTPSVDVFVPVALAVVLVAVWRVRTVFVRAWLQGSWSPRYLDPRGARYQKSWPADDLLTRDSMDTTVIWLVLGALACALVIVRRWWRGRKEWGDVPLAYGVGSCLWVYVFVCWVRFDQHGRLFDAWMNVPFAGTAVLGCLLLMLGYMSYEFCTRRLRGRRVLVLGLLAMAVGVVMYVRGLRHTLWMRGWLPLDDGSRLIVDLPIVARPWDAVGPGLGAGCGGPVYFNRAEELFVARLDCQDRDLSFVDVHALDASTASEEELAARRAADDRTRAWFDPDDWNRAGVALARDVEAVRLHEVATDMRQRFPSLTGFLVTGTGAGRYARGAGYTDRPLQTWWGDWTSLGWFELAHTEPHLVLDVRPGPGGVQLGPPDTVRAIENALGWSRESPGLQIRLRIHPGVSLEELGEIYGAELYGRMIRVCVE